MHMCIASVLYRNFPLILTRYMDMYTVCVHACTYMYTCTCMYMQIEAGWSLLRLCVQYLHIYADSKYVYTCTLTYVYGNLYATHHAKVTVLNGLSPYTTLPQHRLVQTSPEEVQHSTGTDPIHTCTHRQV